MFRNTTLIALSVAASLFVGGGVASAQSALLAWKDCNGTFDSGQGHFQSSGGFEMHFDPQGSAKIRRAYGYYAYHYAQDWAQGRQPTGMNTVGNEQFGPVVVRDTADGITFTNKENTATITIHYRADGSFTGTFEPFPDKRDHWHESALVGACR